MKMKQFRCRCCHKICTARVQNQKYCSQGQCQKARRNAWYREKCASDPDYRANQKASNQSWLESKGGAAAYFREYRKRRRSEEKKAVKLAGMTQSNDPSGNDNDTELRTEIKGLCKSAKLDVVFTKKPFKSGRYIMIPDHSEPSAKLDATIVEITMISSG